LLLNNLYTIQSISEAEKTIQASVLLRADHAIFKGHFPGQPVLPGVCMLEMITEIASAHLLIPLRITGAPLIKFLNMINPGNDPQIHFEIKYDSSPRKITTQGKIYCGSRVFMKFQMILVPVNKN
jgi:3-hydroxyacyl-[acyl-carrier-protein] dehydratase